MMHPGENFFRPTRIEWCLGFHVSWKGTWDIGWQARATSVPDNLTSSGSWR